MTRVRHVLVALAGVLVGHEIVHAFPHDHANDAAHGYIPIAVAFIVPIGLVAFVSLVREGVTRRHLDLRPLQIAALQVYLFGVQETAEAIGTGASLTQFLVDPVLWVGIAIQVGVASLIAGSLGSIRWLRVHTSTVRAFAVAVRRLHVDDVWRPRLGGFRSSLTTRGPPVPVS